MDKYEVMLYPQAYRDIDEIYAYIALEKQSPENAQGQTDRIWDAIDSLEFFRNPIRTGLREGIPEKVINNFS